MPARFASAASSGDVNVVAGQRDAVAATFSTFRSKERVRLKSRDVLVADHVSGQRWTWSWSGGSPAEFRIEQRAAARAAGLDQEELARGGAMWPGFLDRDPAQDGVLLPVVSIGRDLGIRNCMCIAARLRALQVLGQPAAGARNVGALVGPVEGTAEPRFAQLAPAGAGRLGVDVVAVDDDAVDVSCRLFGDEAPKTSRRRARSRSRASP